MKHRIYSSFIIASALFAHGCGQGDASPPGTPGGPPAAGTTATKAAGFEFSTGPFEIQPGDTFECFYTNTITDHQLNVQTATAQQGPGGHHVTVYYTDQQVPVGHHPCNDVEMLGLHQIAGAAEGKEGIIGLPDGYATKVPPGKQLVVQSHYIRTEPGPLTVDDKLELQTVDEANVKAFANAFVLVDGNFHLPPRTTSKSVTDCVVPKDLDVLLLLGHMHEWGSHYKIERIDDAGKPAETIYETDWEPLFLSHPPVNAYGAATPLKLTKGMRLRQTCEWKNTEDQEMAFPREMCVMFSYYIPDDGFLQCEMHEVKP
jgi:hypothetical protein